MSKTGFIRSSLATRGRGFEPRLKSRPQLAYYTPSGLERNFTFYNLLDTILILYTKEKIIRQFSRANNEI